jgi:DNA polymerase III gamma/tau subunit
MATSGLAEVISLSFKAAELYKKSHWERCLEKWRAALAAAEARGAEDCVIVAHLKTDVARALRACENAYAGGRNSQAIVQELLDLYAASAAALRRRRDAGTLMENMCRPTEAQWVSEYLTGGRTQTELGRLDALIRVQVKLFGYDAFLDVCTSSMSLLCAALSSGTFERGGEAERKRCSAARPQVRCRLTARKTQILQQSYTKKPAQRRKQVTGDGHVSKLHFLEDWTITKNGS